MNDLNKLHPLYIEDINNIFIVVITVFMLYDIRADMKCQENKGILF